MTFHFKIGKHRPRPIYWLRWFILLFNRTEIKRQVVFPFSSKYELDNGDQQDWNKLFGISFTMDPHDGSARYGWAYNPEKQRFELSAYCYLNGEQVMEHLCDCIPNLAYDCHLIITREDYKFRVYRKSDMAVMCSAEFSKGHRRRNGYLLGPFFGGNQAPKKLLTIQLKKI